MGPRGTAAPTTAFRTRLEPSTNGRVLGPKPTLRNTQRNAHAILISFYDWTMEEGIGKDNPARQVRKAKKRSTSVYWLTETRWSR